MNTDEMILELVATGKFTLPEGVSWRGSYRGGDKYIRFYVLDNDSDLAQRFAHDLCAMSFAREATRGTGLNSSKCFPWMGPMQRGDSARAIAALHEAMCAKR